MSDTAYRLLKSDGEMFPNNLGLSYSNCKIKSARASTIKIEVKMARRRRPNGTSKLLRFPL